MGSMLTEAAPTERGSRPIRVISKNLRIALTNLTKFEPNEYPWSPEQVPGKLHYRKDLIIDELKEYGCNKNASTFMVLQEALYDQVKDVVSGLNGGGINSFPDIRSNREKNEVEFNGTLGRTDYQRGKDGNKLNDSGYQWSYLGVGRDDGGRDSEIVPIIYRPSEWSVVSWRTLWLSHEKSSPGDGPGFGGENRRIATHGIFESKDDHKTRIVVIATHLDEKYWDENDEVRRKQLELLALGIDAYTGRNEIAKESKYNYPVILGADFNANSSAPSIEGFKHGNLNTNIGEFLRKKGRAWGPINSYTSFGEKWWPDNMDFLWATPWSADGTKVRGEGKCDSYFSLDGNSRFGVVSDNTTGVYNSDHNLVLADMTLVY